MEQEPEKNQTKNTQVANEKDGLVNKTFSFLKSSKDSKDSEPKQKGDGVRKVIGAKHIEEGHTQIKNMAAIALSPKDHLKNAKVENFQQAMQRQGRTVHDLPLIHKNFYFSFYAVATMGIISLLFGLFNIFSGQSLITGLACASMALFCFCHAFNLSFRCFQIKHQKLCSVQDYLKHKEFLPTKFKFNNKG